MSSITLRIANETPRGESLARHLRDAHGFVEIALAACAAAREQELDCTLSMLSSRGDPMIVVEHVVAVERMFSYSMPISALTARIGVIRWSSEQPIGERTSQLVGMGIHVAVRLAQLGHVSCLDEEPLTPRQVATARLAARGFTNVEIAAQLGVSENTIKKHIGEVFKRLNISNRTELALQFPRLATVDLEPAGISYVGDCRIVRTVRAV